jgi:hypothetical protein
MTTFDQMYDEMLGLEFSARGKHARGWGAQPAEAVATAVAAGEIASHARHAKAESVEADAAAPSEHERPTGLARYRNAAIVGAGGLACATVGALLGGLGGYFTVSPAAAHAVGSTTADGQSSPAVHRSAHSSDSTPSASVPASAFSPVSGGLTQAGSGVGSITASPSPNSPVPGVPAPGSPIAGGSGPGAGSGGSGGTGGGGSTGGGTDTPTQPTQPTPPAPCQSVCVSVPSLPAPLPVPLPTVPALPVPTPLPVTVQTSPTSSGGTTATVTAPVPLPTTPTTTVGPVSVGTTSGTSSTSGGLTLSLG